MAANALCLRHFALTRPKLTHDAHPSLVPCGLDRPSSLLSGQTTPPPILREMGSRKASDDEEQGVNKSTGQSFRESHATAPLSDFKNPLPDIWKDSPIKVQDSYFLQSLAVTLSKFDYPAAVFWGFELVLLYNQAWEDAGGIREQGRPQRGSLSPDAWHALQKCINGGRPSRISSHALLRERPKPERDAYMVLVSPLFEPNSENAQGVVCQMVYNHRHGLPDTPATKDGKGSSNQSMDEQATQTNPNMTFLGQQTTDSTPLDEHPFFHRFAEMIPTGLAILDHNARAVFVNQHFYQLTTHWGEDQSFKSWPQSIHPEDYDRVMSAYKEAFRGQTELRAEFRALGSDHPWRLLLLTPLGDENLKHVSLGEYGGFICSVVDITSEKSAENDQRIAAEEARERKKQQERFIDMISHEIRNPLTAMVHCVEDINEALKLKEQSGKFDTDSIAEALDTINLCISHQKNIVDDVLSYSKLDSSMLALTPKPCRAERELQGNTKMFITEFRKHDIEFDFRVDEPYKELEVDWTMADLSRIGQVLINLISNAIKFTSRKEGKRKITCSISASLKRPDSYPPNMVFFNNDRNVPRLDATQRPEWGSGESLFVMVAVADSGIGIGEADQAKLFERFKQATPKTNEIYGGSGLGLNISRKLVQLHGGEIGVSAKEGEGATFGFFFRVKRANPPDEDDKDQDNKERQASVRGQIRMGGLDSTEESRASNTDESRKPRSVDPLQRAQSSEQRAEQTENLNLDIEKSRRNDEERSKKDTAQGSKSQPRTESENKQKASKQTGGDSEIARTGESINPTAHHRAGSSNVTDKAPAEVGGKADETSIQSTEPRSKAAGGLQRAIPMRKRKDMKEQPHVLLVEDNDINNKLFARKLASKGFVMSTAKDGREAVDFVIASFTDPANAGKGEEGKTQREIDIVLMDQQMPVMDGNAATAEIRQRELEMGREKRVPILGISAHSRDEQLQEMIQSGMDGFITKPYKIEEMVAKISGMIDD